MRIFPSTDIPLREHVEDLKSVVERIMPDPRDRSEEMFSGEIFALLGAIYLHDTGLVKDCKWDGNDVTLSAFDTAHKKILVNSLIGRHLDIPERAIEIVNYLSLSDIIRKTPVKWEITEGEKKALIRNPRVLGHIFDFSHLILDVFYADFRYSGLRRYTGLKLPLDRRRTEIEIDSREGVIRIKYHATSPYEHHRFESAKAYVNGAFTLFRNNVNGRLGLQYREIKWEVTGDPDYETRVSEEPCIRDERKWPLLDRWEEAACILDRTFDLGYAMVVGEESAGKTTVLRSFVLPQLTSVTANAFYCEIWENPVREVRDVIFRRRKGLGYSGLDIISVCKQVLGEGPCFFVLDACERVAALDQKEKEKLERFLNFCLGEENAYLIVSGDKEGFLDWFTPMSKMNMSSIFEIKAPEGVRAGDAAGWNSGRGRAGDSGPIKWELLHGGVNVEVTLKGIVDEADEAKEIRGILACLIEMNEKHLKRYTVDDIRLETCIPGDRILRCLEVLKREGIITRSEFSGSVYYSLSSRYLKTAVYGILNLRELEGKKDVRNMIHDSFVNEVFLDKEALDLIQEWQYEMVFSREEMGLIIGSLIDLGEDCGSFLGKARQDESGIDIQPILKFIYSGEAEKRARAIEVLVDIQDKNMVNPLLIHLRKEKVHEIRDLLIKGIGRTGKKRTMIAIIQTLREIGDSHMRVKSIQLFHSLLGKNAKGLLQEIKEREEDPVVLEEVERLLSNSET